MVVRFEHVWISIPLLFIPIAFTLLMQFIVKVWMIGAPVNRRPFPRYSLHVMDELPPEKPVQKDPKYPSQPKRPAPKYPGDEEPEKVKPLPYVRGPQSGANTPYGVAPSVGSYAHGSQTPQRAWRGKFI